MDKKSKIQELWQECFNDTPEFVGMYFNRMYSDDNALLLEKNGTPASAMLLQRYAMNFHGDVADMGYICGAATSANARCNGYMQELLSYAISQSFRRGDLLCALIPASERLYEYYSRFGFAPVFHFREEHYTSLHTFQVHDRYYRDENQNAPDIYTAFSGMMRQRMNCVLHNEDDFLCILEDNRLDNGSFIIMRNGSGEIVSMAWSVERNGQIIVYDILSRDYDARNAALDEIRRHATGKPITVWGYPEESNGGQLKVHGMARVINAGQLLDRLAAKYPRYNTSIRISDPIIPENNHTFILDSGHCSIDDTIHGPAIDFDLYIDTFTSIVFSSEKTGYLLGFPTHPPFMSLMMDQ